MNNNRLKTSKETDYLLEELNSVLGFSTKAAIIRIAISLSLKEKLSPMDIQHLNTDQNGFEIQRATLFGDFDMIYKALIIQHHGEYLTDDEYFPKMVYLHIERGVSLLHNEYRLSGNKNKLYMQLLQQCRGEE